jgi:hypothetical protein
MKKLLFCLLLLGIAASLFAQTPYFQVRNIEIEGNKRTKRTIILRELDFTIGDTLILGQVAIRLERNRNQLLNTRLFSEVTLNVKNWESQVLSSADIFITVKEFPPIIPLVWADLADRDFNIWWKRFNFSPKRISPYIQLTHLNLTGRQDEFKAKVQTGFTRKLEFRYNLPYLDRQQKLRANAGILIGDDKEARLVTVEDRDSFLRDETSRLFKRFRILGGLSYRPDLFDSHSIQVRFSSQNIADTVAQLNPDFFLEGRQNQRFLAVDYNFIADHRDFRLFATKGYYLNVGIKKEGLGLKKDINTLITSVLYAKYWSLSPIWSLELAGSAEVNWVREKQPYFNNPVVGPEPNLLRGHELHQVRGTDFGLVKTGCRLKVLDTELDLGKKMPISSLKIVPLKAFLHFYSDFGYVNNLYYKTANPLSNKLLWSGGIGIDILGYNSGLSSIQLSMNQLGERGIYFHTDLVF